MSGRLIAGEPMTPVAEPVLTSHPMTLAEALRPFFFRFCLAIAYFLVVFLIGMTGYMIIERWAWHDALYMAVTTVTSVGYMEVYALSEVGRTFTMGLIFLGVSGLGVWWALTTALIVELDLGGVLRRRRIMKNIEQLSEHFIVCGAGRMGRVVIGEMVAAGRSFVVIENQPARIAQVQESYPNLLVIEADATREQTLLSAGVERASGLATCLADDADNLLVCLTARELNDVIPTVARAYNEESVEKLRRAGADHVISPNQTGGVRMAFTLLRPAVISFLDAAITDAGIEMRLEQASIPASSHLVGQTLAEAQIPQQTGLIVLALRRGIAGPPLYNPGPETHLEAGDVMILIGASDQVERLRNYAEVEVTL
jgi:voltage-gated potassium channel